MGKNHKYRDLFETENRVLQSALQNISSGEYTGNSLLSHYKQLALNYKKLLKLSSKVISISDRQQWSLKQVESALKELLDNAGQGFLTFGEDLRIDREYSAECRRIFNANIENANILELLRTSDDEEQDMAFADAFNNVFKTSDEDAKTNYLKRLKDKIRINSRYIAIEYKLIKRIEQENEKEAVMLILSDITDKHAAEEKINYLSYHDKLTGLYNRAYVDNILSEFHDEQQLPLSMIMADLNGLKLTNDVFGHVIGDKLLKNIAAVFSKCCRQSDIVARWGGDEFIIILPGTNKDICESVCQRIRHSCQTAGIDPIELSAALGISTLNSLNEDMLECFRQAETMMYQNKLTESENNRHRIIQGLKNKLWQIGHENKEHCQRIAVMVDKLAEKLNLSPSKKKDLRLLAYLHDIGKVAVPMEILEKPEPLTPAEWEMMKKHCDAGYRMAQAINEPKLADAILSHHEHFNGRGYPRGRKREEIPLIARLLSVVDAYDAMTNDRPYKKALSSELAIEELRRLSGSQFDPQIVEIFIDMVHKTCN